MAFLFIAPGIVLGEDLPFSCLVVQIDGFAGSPTSTIPIETFDAEEPTDVDRARAGLFGGRHAD
ncbi:hypothetical protein [Rhizobium sp.]|uniref:hypothetical protein n=1 Tax=Rhizobium sp. TaxID=391 RepID=UPI0028ABBBEC